MIYKQEGYKDKSLSEIYGTTDYNRERPNNEKEQDHTARGSYRTGND